MSTEGRISTEPSLCGQLRNGRQFWLPSQLSHVLSAWLLAAGFRVNGACLASVPGLQQPRESSGSPFLPSHQPLTLPVIVLTGAIKGLCLGGRQCQVMVAQPPSPFRLLARQLLLCGQSSPVADTIAIRLKSPP